MKKTSLNLAQHILIRQWM